MAMSRDARVLAKLDIPFEHFTEWQTAAVRFAKSLAPAERKHFLMYLRKVGALPAKRARTGAGR